MDPVKFKELATCSICFQLFNEGNNCPRMLACGHTFCHSCIEKILNDIQLCPTCETRIKSLDVESIPLNLFAKSFISVEPQEDPSKVLNGSPKRVGTPTSLKLESKGFCAEHSNYKELRCMDCETWICGICSNLNHKNCRTLLVKDSIKEMNDQFVQKIVKELESREWVNHNIDSTVKACERREKDMLEGIEKTRIDVAACGRKIQELKSFKSKDLEYCESLKQLQTTFENTETEEEFSKTKIDFEDLLGEGRRILTEVKGLNLHRHGFFATTFEELKILCAKEPVHLVRNKGKILYGLVTVKKNQIWISNFRCERPKGRLLPLKEFLFRFSGSFELPKRAFLKLTSDNQILSGKEEVELVIETDGTSSSAKNFISQCSGLCSYDSYIGKKLSYHDSSYYDLYLDLFFSSCMNEKISQGSWKEGAVFGKEDGAYFGIELEEFSGYSYPEIGVVVSGLNELKKSKEWCFKIEDCGIVI